MVIDWAISKFLCRRFLYIVFFPFMRTYQIDLTIQVKPIELLQRFYKFYTSKAY
jgi:hypothetical protein